MSVELTVRDMEILDFLKKVGIASRSHLRAFVGYRQRNLERLAANNKIVLSSDMEIVKMKLVNLSKEDEIKMLKCLDFAEYLLKEALITKDIEAIDLPYYLRAYSKMKGTLLFLTMINHGQEDVYCKLIDVENYGDTLLLLETRAQVEKLRFVNPVKKVFFYDELMT